MTLPIAIKTQIDTLGKAVLAANPITKADRNTVRGLKSEAVAMVLAVDKATAALEAPIHSPTMPNHILLLPKILLDHAETLQTQCSLVQSRGPCGRITANLTQLAVM